MTHRRKFSYPTNPTHSTGSGFTMVELLVSVAVLAILIIAIGQVFSQGQQVVTRSQGRMRANNAASAITHVIRSDLRKVSKLGFLYIEDGTDGDKLVFTTAGLTQSIDGNAEGQGGIASYGLCDNDAPDTADSVIYRQGWVLDATDYTPDNGGADQYPTDFSEIQAKDVAGMQAEATAIVDKAPPSTGEDALKIPPVNIADVGNLWQCLVKDCSSLEIAYLEHNDTTLDWKTATATWTRHDQSEWPKAIKIKFKVNDQSLPDELSASGGVEYEIICPIE